MALTTPIVSPVDWARMVSLACSQTPMPTDAVRVAPSHTIRFTSASMNILEEKVTSSVTAYQPGLVISRSSSVRTMHSAGPWLTPRPLAHPFIIPGMFPSLPSAKLSSDPP